YAGAQALARFRTEAEAVGRLEHPNIVRVYDVGQHDGRPYLTMEYLDGGSLAEQLTGTPLPARQAAQLVETLARAVHYAHQRGVVHRDLKPGNILLARSQESGVRSQESEKSAALLTPDSCLLTPVPKIADFGLAKLLIGGGEGPTQTRDIAGTPSHMAPE